MTFCNLGSHQKVLPTFAFCINLSVRKLRDFSIMNRPQSGLDDFLVEAPCTLDFMLWKLTLKLIKCTQSHPFFASTVLKLLLLPQHPLSYMTSKNLSSCPHACITNSLSTKPSISSPNIMFGRYTSWNFQKFSYFLLLFFYVYWCLDM